LSNPPTTYCVCKGEARHAAVTDDGPSRALNERSQQVRSTEKAIVADHNTANVFPAAYVFRRLAERARGNGQHRICCVTRLAQSKAGTL